MFRPRSVSRTKELLSAIVLSSLIVLTQGTQTYATVDDTRNLLKSGVYYVDATGAAGVCGDTSTIIGGEEENLNIPLRGETNEEKVWNFFSDIGLEAVQVAGIMGSLSVESGFDPFNQENAYPFTFEGRGGWGLAQWTAGRRDVLRDAVITELGEEYYIPTEQAGAFIGGIEEENLLRFQLQHLVRESKGRTIRSFFTVDGTKIGPEGAVDATGQNIRNEWDALKLTKTTIQATYFWEDNFERPASALQSKRVDIADRLVDTYLEGGTNAAASFSCSATTAGASDDVDTSNLSCPDGTVDEGTRQDYSLGRAPTVRLRVCTINEANGNEAVTIRIVNASIAGAAKSMAEAAERDGVILVGSAYRSYDEQISLRIKNCNGNTTDRGARCRPPTAVPGNSQHEVGLAIDFSSIYSFSGCGGSTCPSSPSWVWLTENAATYGFKQLRSESWHWSPSGS